MMVSAANTPNMMPMPTPTSHKTTQTTSFSALDINSFNLNINNIQQQHKTTITNTNNNNNMTPMSKSYSLDIISPLRETIETPVSDNKGEQHITFMQLDQNKIQTPPIQTNRFIYPSPQPQLITENKYDNDNDNDNDNEIYEPYRRWSLSDNLEEYGNKDINNIDLKYSLIDNIMKVSPERLTKKLQSLCNKYGVIILGPSTVGGICAGKFRIGNTGGMLDNIVASKLYKTCSNTSNNNNNNNNMNLLIY